MQAKKTKNTNASRGVRVRLKLKKSFIMAQTLSH
jgi:hypothetical protein